MKNAATYITWPDKNGIEQRRCIRSIQTDADGVRTGHIKLNHQRINLIDYGPNGHWIENDLLV